MGLIANTHVLMAICENKGFTRKKIIRDVILAMPSITSSLAKIYSQQSEKLKDIE